MKRELLAPAVRDRLKRLPAPHADHEGVVPAPPPEHEIALAGIAARHEAAVAAMARVDALAEEGAAPFLVSRLLPRQEAVESSAIEGTNSTLDELLSVEESTDVAATADTRQVRDYALLLGQFIERAKIEGPRVFTRDLVQDIHARVMREDPAYRDRPGSLRDGVVWIGSGSIAHSTWNAPPPEDVAACLEQSLRYMRSEGSGAGTQSFIIRMAIAHAHFEAVHPFRDGNGRVGRILLPLAMAAEGHTPLYLSPFIEARRGGYSGALKKAQQQLDWPAIIGFMCEAIVATVAHLDETVQALAVLRDDWVRRRSFRKNSAARRALDVIIDYPVVTTSRLAAQLGVGFPRASGALAALSDSGILTERTGHKRNRVFVATDVLAIVNRPFEA